MPRAPHNRVDTPVNQPTPPLQSRQCFLFYPWERGKISCALLVSPRRSSFFIILWESQVSEIRWNCIFHWLIGEVTRLVSRGHIVTSAQKALVSLCNPQLSLRAN